MPGIVMELNPVFKGDKRFKEKPNANGIKEWDLRVRAHPVKLPTCENELKRSLGLGVEVQDFNHSTW